jgi:hypothetical protein
VTIVLCEIVASTCIASSFFIIIALTLFFPTCSRQATASTSLAPDREIVLGVIVGGGRTTESPWLSLSIVRMWRRRPWLMCSGGRVEIGGAHVSLEWEFWCQPKDAVRWMSVQYKSS